MRRRACLVSLMAFSSALGQGTVQPPAPPRPPAGVHPAPMPPLVPPVPSRDEGPLDPSAPEASLYGRGTRMVERMHWDRAIEAYNAVIARGGAKTEGALYWKAYAARKVGRTEEALAAIRQLASKYPKSRWLNDAKALEIEVKQASGRPIRPEDQRDEELRVFAIHALARQDSSRALPLLEKLLLGSDSPAVKGQVLFVLSQMQDSPKAREILLRTAKGQANPDLQLQAIGMLGIGGHASAELAALYDAGLDNEAKRTIIGLLGIQKDVKPLVEIARREKDPDLKRAAVQRLATVNSKEASDLLIEILEK